MSLLLGKKPKLEECLGGGHLHSSLQKHRSEGSQTNIKHRLMTPPNTGDAIEQPAVRGLQQFSLSCPAWPPACPTSQGTPAARRASYSLSLWGFAVRHTPTPQPQPCGNAAQLCIYFFSDNVSDSTAECEQPVSKKTELDFFFFWRGVQLGLLGGLRLSVDSNSGGEPTFVRCKRPTASQLFF